MESGKIDTSGHTIYVSEVRQESPEAEMAFRERVAAFAGRCGVKLGEVGVVVSSWTKGVRKGVTYFASARVEEEGPHTPVDFTGRIVEDNEVVPLGRRMPR